MCIGSPVIGVILSSLKTSWYSLMRVSTDSSGGVSRTVAERASDTLCDSWKAHRFKKVNNQRGDLNIPKNAPVLFYFRTLC